nr:retrovirus-related Pol polyprotein from transposon TNT 1-94 [Tanacetum cinerariifolium]
IYEKASLFLRAEVVATACYTQNRSIIRLRYGKTPYELLHDKLPDLSFFHVFGALCYPTNDSKNLGKLQPKADIVALEPTASTGSPSSTTVDQDAPSPSNSQTTYETQSPVISNDFVAENHDLDVAHMNNNPFFGIPIPENDFESSSSDVIPTIVHTATPNSEHVTKWTKDHPLDNIYGKRIKAIAKVAKSGKKKLPVKGLETLSEVALSKAEQMKIAIKRSKTQFYSSQASDSSAHEGTGVIPGGSRYDDNADDEDDNDQDDDNADNEDDNDQDDDNEQTELDNDGDDFVHPKLSAFNEE